MPKSVVSSSSEEFFERWSIKCKNGRRRRFENQHTDDTRFKGIDKEKIYFIEIEKEFKECMVLMKMRLSIAKE